MSIREQLKNSIERFVKLGEEEFEHCFRFFKQIEIKKGAQILTQGDYCNHIYFIIEGCMKYFYVTDGEERIGQFFFENGWFTDLYSFLDRAPSKMNLGAIENSKLLSLHYDDLQTIYREVPKMERFGRLQTEYTFVNSQQRSASFLTQSPAENYQHLVNTRPKVVSRVPQYMIASYLGIQPKSLSRIRKKIAKKMKE